jgi:hypothetical protein
MTVDQVETKANGLQASFRQHCLYLSLFAAANQDHSFVNADIPVAQAELVPVAVASTSIVMASNRVQPEPTLHLSFPPPVPSVSA